MKQKSRRIGIYSGTFDPVHAGHISFALQALRAAQLDRIYFLPERRPRYKPTVEHYGHRVAMLEHAIQPYRRFGVLDYVDVNFSVERTLPKLQHNFSGDQLIFLLGSDSARHLESWPRSETLLRSSELVIGIRAGDDSAAIEQMMGDWKVQPLASYVFMSYAADVSAGKVRDALRQNQTVRGLLQSVARYSNRHWLYISLG